MLGEQLKERAQEQEDLHLSFIATQSIWMKAGGTAKEEDPSLQEFWAIFPGLPTEPADATWNGRRCSASV